VDIVVINLCDCHSGGTDKEIGSLQIEIPEKMAVLSYYKCT